MEKLRYKLPNILATTLFFGFLAFVGFRIAQGDDLGADRGGILAKATSLLGFLSDAVGHTIAGFGLMGLAAIAAVGVAVWIWRDPMM